MHIMCILCACMHTDGIRIYRKTLKESTKGRPEEVQNRVRVRSRQQRVSSLNHHEYCG